MDTALFNRSLARDKNFDYMMKRDRGRGINDRAKLERDKTRYDSLKLFPRPFVRDGHFKSAYLWKSLWSGNQARRYCTDARNDATYNSPGESPTVNPRKRDIVRDRIARYAHPPWPWLAVIARLVSQGWLNLNRYGAMADYNQRSTSHHRLSNFSIRNAMR